MNTGWAHSGAVGSSGVFEAVHSGLTVQLIETSRGDLVTCTAGDPASLIIERNTEQYDFIPVTEDSGTTGGRIVGLFHAAGFRDGPAPCGPVADHLLPLSEEYLIGADASILDFVTDADTRPCRLALAGPSISGLVSLSDLQRLPVRAALFALITGLEITMAEAIGRTFPANADWMPLLSKCRQAKIDAEIRKSKDSDAFVDPLLFTQFADKSAIITKTCQIGESKSALEGRLKKIEKLRDKVAHANEYAATPEHARNVCAVVRDLLVLRKEIESANVRSKGRLARGDLVMAELLSLRDAVAELVHDGDTVAMEGFTHLIPHAAGHEVIRQGRKDLTLVRMTPDLIYDQLIGMGCAKKLVFSWGGNPGVGSLHRLRDAVEKGWPGPLEIEEHSHAGLANAYVAGAAGLPFAVLRGYVGSDLPRHSERIRSITCPFSGERLAAVPSIRPDCTIIHAQKADRKGNVLIWGILGVQKEAALAARRVLVTVEEVVDHLDAWPDACILPHWAVAAVCLEPGGAYPSYAQDYSERDNRFYQAWDPIARSRETFTEWMQKHVLETENCQEFRRVLGETTKAGAGQ